MKEHKLLVDISHILKACMYTAGNQASATTIEFEGKDVKIPDAHEGYEIFLASYMKTLRTLKMVPMQTVLVKDGANCKAMRREFLPGYCIRAKGPNEWMQEYYKTLDMVEETILSYGGASVVKDGWEADDLIAALASKLPHMIWSGDKDALAAGDVFYKGVVNEDKFLGIDNEFIVVYKSLVGDNSDKIPGGKNFGEKTFIKMLVEYGDECLPELKRMLEDGTLHELDELQDEFLGFKKIMASQEQIYNSYDCARFHDPGYDLTWKMAYPSGNGDLKKWEPTTELITKDKMDDPFLDELCKLLNESPNNALDIETYTTPEGKAWMEANKNKQGKMPLDVLGSKLAGFSITTGDNSHITYYFPVDHLDTNNISLEDAEYILNMLPTPDMDIPLLIQNANFELAVLRMHFELEFDRGWLPQLLYDTQIMAGYVDEYDFSNLKHNSKRWLDYEQVTYEDVLGERTGMDELTGQEAFAYGCDDTICTSSLYRFYRMFMDYEESWDCYEEVDLFMPFIYTERYINGVKFDQDKLTELQGIGQEKYNKLYAGIQDRLLDLVWEEEIETTAVVPKKKITISDMKNIKEIAAAQKQAEVEYQTITRYWPGSVFIPAVDLSSKEIKRLYEIHTLQQLTTRVRKLDKIAKVIEDLGYGSFANMVRQEDLDGLNSLVKQEFTPAVGLNVQSPKQMTSLMYDYLGLPVRIRGKISPKMREEGKTQGNPSANEDALRHAIVYDLQNDEDMQQFFRDLIGAKACLTEDGLYFRPYKNMPHYSDGMVHPQFKISAQKSGRGTASTPNDSQVAKDSGVREIYTPFDPDYLWVSLDLSSQELVHTAWRCQDENMLNCFRGERRDIHSVTGTKIHNLDNKPITYEAFNNFRKTDKKFKDIRNKKAKATNFLKNYGGTYISLAVKLLISEEESKEMLVAQSSAFPGIDPWIEEMVKINAERGYAVTPLGRRRHIANVLDGTWQDDHQIRAAGNHPIQGGSAEQIKLILKEYWLTGIFDRFDAVFSGTVHDETNAVVHKDDVLEFIKEAHPIMCQRYADIGLDFRSSIEIGTNFGNLVEIGEEIDEEKITKLIDSLR